MKKAFLFFIVLPPVQLELKEIEIGDESSWLEVKAYDENKVFCPDARNVARFSVAG